MRLAVLSCLVLLLAVPASAQRARPWARKGDTALVIGVSGVSLSDLTPAFGGIGVRYRVTDRTVVGTSVGFGYSTVDFEGDSGSDTNQNVSVALWNENHVGRSGALVSPFLGAGVLFRVNQNDREEEVMTCTQEQCPGPAGVATFESMQTTFGVGALLGAEVRLARGVTLGGAYTLGVEVTRATNDATFPGPQFPQPRQDATVVRVGTGATNLNLSVYF